MLVKCRSISARMEKIWQYYCGNIALIGFYGAYQATKNVSTGNVILVHKCKLKLYVVHNEQIIRIIV